MLVLSSSPKDSQTYVKDLTLASAYDIQEI